MSRGDLVRLHVYGGDEVTRRVIEEGVDTIYVCREEEYQSAITENREPIGVGFPREFIIDRVEESSKA